eukprot:TRINITY_DN50374_c0_g1_i1.p1 TRINITY_DN50374_c0_g1~~TRINITY_DN50374_c0_g1_i1.p1  ORF type:complete len:118 (-),score=1.66 TRINITY_DN50374_c0_g1_i1:202-510(-)
MHADRSCRAPGVSDLSPHPVSMRAQADDRLLNRTIWEDARTNAFFAMHCTVVFPVRLPVVSSGHASCSTASDPRRSLRPSLRRIMYLFLCSIILGATFVEPL